MRKIILLMAVGLMLPMFASAQYSISGRILDLSENISLPGAHVVIKGSFQGVFSDRDGLYKLENLAPGKYVVRVTYLGFKAIDQVIQLENNLILDIMLEPNATMTEEVVVSALRASGRNPVTYTNVDREHLESRNLGQDLPMLLNQTPSLIVSSDAGTGIGYTWMNIRGSDQSRINVTMNGIPVNDAESHGVWWVNMPDIASSIDNLQVQRGVGLSTHGAGAFGATINLQSTSLRDETYAEINTSAGSFNTMKNTVSFGTGLKDSGWAFDGRLSKINSDGFIDRAFADLTSFYLSGGYYGERSMIKGVVFSGKETTYQAWNGVPSDSLSNNRTFNPSGMFINQEGQVSFYDNETDNYQQDHYQLHVSHSFHPGLYGNIAFHYTYGRGYYEQYRQNERFSRYGLPGVVIGDQVFDRSDLVRRRWLDNHFYGTTYSLNYNNFDGFELVFGGGYNEYDGDHFGEIIWARHALNTDIGHRYYDNNGFKKDLNTFVKAAYELGPGLQIFADVQFRYVSYSFLGNAWVHEEVVPLQQKALFRFFNPKAGISYELNPRQSIYLFGGIGNREPVRRDFTESSPDSRPRHETLRNIELGYRHHENRAMFGFNFYLMDYVDQLVLTGEINDVGGFSRVNIDNSQRFGFEMEGSFRFGDFMQWNGNFTISRSKIDLFEEYSDKYDANWNWIGTDVRTYENTDIAFSPRVVAASGFRFTPFKMLTVYFESKYVGEQFIDNTMSKDRMLESYLVNDLRLATNWSPGFLGEVEFVVQINNIFDRKYETNAWVYKGVVGDMGLIAIDDGYFPQAGRHLMLGLNLRF